MSRQKSCSPSRPIAKFRRLGGVTLLELIVVMAVLGLTATIAGLALWEPSKSDGAITSVLGAIRTARAAAVATGRSVTIEVVDVDDTLIVRARPDGRVLGAEALGVDPLSGVSAPKSVTP